MVLTLFVAWDVSIAILNSDIYVVEIVILIGALTLFLHHLFWPVIVRVLYLIQDSGLAENRKILLPLAFGLALAALFSPQTSPL
ncbi:MAG: hypothetical protein ABSE51_23220 [Terracidiphilus sp.]|jgi:hypothetical protein